MATCETITTTIRTEEIHRESSSNDSLQVNNNNNNHHQHKENQKSQYESIIGTFEAELKWVNIVSIVAIHVVFIWGLTAFPYLHKLRLIAYGFLIGGFTGFGVTGGAHRLWCHRSYKAKLPLRIILMLCYSMAAQNTLFDWVRDHRVHHKFTETEADPHNSNRGFFFAHVGWLMMKKHPEVIRRGKEVDMSDVLADPVVQFHQKYFLVLKLLVGFIIPSVIPPLLWDEDWAWSFLLVCVGRYVISLNNTWSVNSAAHIWGNRPYDKNIGPTENLTVSIIAMGEGWHNYHHTFPWDYKTAELGRYSVNLTTFYIDLFSKIGWAYDLKEPSKSLVKRVIEKHGDGSHEVFGHVEVSPDEDVEESPDDKKLN